MGLLDDAIREHLELKRKHGASEEEIVRAQHEALTPARRDPTADPGAGVPPVEHVPGEALDPSLSDEAPPTMPAATDAPPPPDLEAPAPAEPLAEPEPELAAPEAVDLPDQPTAIRPVPPEPEPEPEP